MIHLGTLVLGPFGEMAPVGAFLYAPDRPPWDSTTDVNGELATIKAATVVDAEDLGQQALCVVVRDREKAPLIADEGTRLWSLDREGWVPLSKLAALESIRVPDVTNAGVVVTWAKVHTVMRAPLPDRLFLDANKMWARLVLMRGHYSFASPCAFIHV
jgi:hypothetical protein